jgi:ankyrin repeat protein
MKLRISLFLLLNSGKGVKERSVTAAGLLEKGADINTRNRYGQTALHLALAHFSSFCHIAPKQFFKPWVDLMAQWIMFLLDHGSDLSLQDVNFNTPFHYCRLIYNHRFDQWLPLVQELLTLGIEKYLNANNKAAAVLQMSNDSGLYPVVLTLFQKDYDEKPCIVCSARDVHNDSPLCLNNSFGTEFLKCEYDKKWQNAEGQSLMHFYALNYRDILHESTVKSLQVFVQTGGDPRLVDKLGRNCLHYNTEFLRALVKVDMPAQLGNVVHDLFTARDVLDRTPIYYINTLNIQAYVKKRKQPLNFVMNISITWWLTILNLERA